MTLSNEYMARLYLMILLSLSVIIGNAQTKVIMGVIRDGHSDERIPFASVQFKKSRAGKLSESAGPFMFSFQDEWAKLESTLACYPIACPSSARGFLLNWSYSTKEVELVLSLS